jgi:hypothetical protein
MEKEGDARLPRPNGPRSGRNTHPPPPTAEDLSRPLLPRLTAARKEEPVAAAPSDPRSRKTAASAPPGLCSATPWAAGEEIEGGGRGREEVAARRGAAARVREDVYSRVSIFLSESSHKIKYAKDVTYMKI